MWQLTVRMNFRLAVGAVFSNRSRSSIGAQSSVDGGITHPENFFTGGELEFFLPMHELDRTCVFHLFPARLIHCKPEILENSVGATAIGSSSPFFTEHITDVFAVKVGNDDASNKGGAMRTLAYHGRVSFTHFFCVWISVFAAHFHVRRHRVLSDEAALEL